MAISCLSPSSSDMNHFLWFLFFLLISFHSLSSPTWILQDQNKTTHQLRNQKPSEKSKKLAELSAAYVFSLGFNFTNWRRRILIAGLWYLHSFSLLVFTFSCDCRVRNWKHILVINIALLKNSRQIFCQVSGKLRRLMAEEVVIRERQEALITQARVVQNTELICMFHVWINIKKRKWRSEIFCEISHWNFSFFFWKKKKLW